MKDAIDMPAEVINEIIEISQRSISIFHLLTTVDNQFRFSLD
jgi:hypothetical protein